MAERPKLIKTSEMMIRIKRHRFLVTESKKNYTTLCLYLHCDNTSIIRLENTHAAAVTMFLCERVECDLQEEQEVSLPQRYPNTERSRIRM